VPVQPLTPTCETRRQLPPSLLLLVLLLELVLVLLVQWLLPVLLA
jgi:hypothetical protein